MVDHIDSDLEQEIVSFCDKMNSLNRNDRRKALRNLFIKHMHLEDSDHMWDYINLVNIISDATSNYVDASVDVYIDQRKINVEQRRIKCITEAVISELRRTGALRKLVKFKKNDLI